VAWLFVAFAIVWGAFFVYLFVLQKRLDDVARRFDELNK
jgi:CcmD family protein